MSTTLIDAYGAGHPRATSGDESRIIRCSHGDDRLYPPGRVGPGRRGWRSATTSASRFLIGCGALWLAHRDDGFEAASEATLRSMDIPVERLTPAEVADALATDQHR